jgi:hypothetical protein
LICLGFGWVLVTSFYFCIGFILLIGNLDVLFCVSFSLFVFSCLAHHQTEDPTGQRAEYHYAQAYQANGPANQSALFAALGNASEFPIRREYNTYVSTNSNSNSGEMRLPVDRSGSSRGLSTSHSPHSPHSPQHLSASSSPRANNNSPQCNHSESLSKLKGQAQAGQFGISANGDRESKKDGTATPPHGLKKKNKSRLAEKKEEVGEYKLMVKGAAMGLNLSVLPTSEMLLSHSPQSVTGNLLMPTEASMPCLVLL